MLSEGASHGGDDSIMAHGRRKKEVSSKLIVREGCATPSAFNMAEVDERVGEAAGVGLIIEGWFKDRVMNMYNIFYQKQLQ